MKKALSFFLLSLAITAHADSSKNASGELRQRFDVAIAGAEDGGCMLSVVETPRLRWLLDDAATALQPGQLIAPAPGGRVYAVVVPITTPFHVDIAQPDGSSQLLGTGLEGWSPLAMVVDRTGRAYVHAYKWPEGGLLLAFDALGQLERTFVLGSAGASSTMDLAADQCTLVLDQGEGRIARFNVCSGTYLSDYPVTPPRDVVALRILPDGGLLLATETFIDRYAADGAFVRTYPIQHASFQPPRLEALALADEGRQLLFAEGCIGDDLTSLDLDTGVFTRVGTTGLWRATSIVPYKAWTAALGTSIRHRPRGIRR